MSSTPSTGLQTDAAQNQLDLAVALICDHKLAIPAGALATRVARLWKVDVHIFIERNDPASQAVVETDTENVYYHYEELLHGDLATLLPDHHRFSRAAWGRIFVPERLKSYGRVLYLDIDIIPGPLPEGIDKMDLPNGIAMVRDSFAYWPNIWKLPAEERYPSPVAKRTDYFNSGVILFDCARYDTTSLAESLVHYMENEGKNSQFPDQDFINLFFAGKVVELSPNMNFQLPLMGLGLVDEEQVAIRHYCSNVKPFHVLPRYGASDALQIAVQIYDEMAQEAGLPGRSLQSYGRIKRLKMIRTFLRSLIAQANIQTPRHKKRLKDWTMRREMALKYLKDAKETGRFADTGGLVLKEDMPAVKFNGMEIVTCDDFKRARKA